jgi:hypothetical protein
MNRNVLTAVLAAAALALGLFASTASGGPGHGTLAVAKASTARFQDVAAAKAAKYGELRDAAGVACIANPGAGAMGVHYVNKRLVSDAAVDARAPEALVYRPLGHGRVRLVAVEYIVFRSAWRQAHAAPPSLFGRRFALVPAGNRYGLPPFYELHAWIWRQNPRGTFDDWNPRVTCGAD